MPQQCTICNHPDRLQIEAALVRGSSLRDVAERFGTSKAATHRHRSGCMKTALVAAQEKQREQTTADMQISGWNAFQEMMWLRGETHQLYREVRGELERDPGEQDGEKTPGDPRLALATLGEIRKQTQLFGELLTDAEQAKQGEREQEWNAIRETIFVALEPFPDARLAVARALLALRDEQGGEYGRIISD